MDNLNQNQKKRLRRKTRGYFQFQKLCICERCKKVDLHTQWHHKQYLDVPILKRRHLKELCQECHNTVDKQEKKRNNE